MIKLLFIIIIAVTLAEPMQAVANIPQDTLGIKLDQNQLNPFVNLTEFQYFVSQQVPVKLVLYDYNGREIAVLIDKYIKPGWHSLIVNGSGLNKA